MGTQTDSAKQLQEAVDKLYDFRDHYYERTSWSVDDKWDRVREMMTKTLDLLEKCMKSSEDIQPSVLQYLMGKTLNVMPEYDSKAQDHLSNAIKLNPSFVDAWNELGECYWKTGNTAAAKNCFHCAIEKNRNKVSLRNLSVVLRQLQPKDVEDRKNFLFEGLHLAKEAVEIDTTDGQSWLILGNSYLSVAFYSAHNESCIQKALAAYRQAENRQGTSVDSYVNSSDLYYNKATALIYDEKFQEALANLESCQKFDPSWDLPKSKLKSTVQLLRGLSQMVHQKGKFKPRKLNILLKGIGAKDWGPFKSSSKLERALLQDLIEGINVGKFMLVKVIASVPYEGGSPFACCVCDSETFAAAVTIYRLSNDYGLTIGDSLLIPEPQMHLISVSIKDEVVHFPCVRVDSPQTILINGHQLKPNQVASMFMKFSSA